MGGGNRRGEWEEGIGEMNRRRDRRGEGQVRHLMRSGGDAP